jgi:phosphoribosylformimino-5-aminoimidazole carboxamide ribotide isomerase
VDNSIIKKFKDVNTSLIFGGGLRDSDLPKLQKMGVNKFLVGTALHAGTFKHSL